MQEQQSPTVQVISPPQNAGLLNLRPKTAGELHVIAKSTLEPAVMETQNMHCDIKKDPQQLISNDLSIPILTNSARVIEID